jgi:HEAT repeat protein
MLAGKIKSDLSYPFLEKMLNDSNEDVKYDVIIAMGKLGDIRALPVLQDGASTEAVKSAAAMSIAKFNDAAISTIESMARSERPAERRQAANILGAIRKPTARRILIHLFSDESSSVRMAALESICEWGRRVARPHLLQLLNDHDKEVSCAAQYWLDALKCMVPAANIAA